MPPEPFPLLAHNIIWTSDLIKKKNFFDPTNNNLPDLNKTLITYNLIATQLYRNHPNKKQQIQIKPLNNQLRTRTINLQKTKNNTKLASLDKLLFKPDLKPIAQNNIIKHTFTNTSQTNIPININFTNNNNTTNTTINKPHPLEHLQFSPTIKQRQKINITKITINFQQLSTTQITLTSLKIQKKINTKKKKNTPKPQNNQTKHTISLKILNITIK